MRPKSEIYTHERDDEHPHPFHMQSPPPPGPAMDSTVFWCLLVLFLVFWLYCITTVTPIPSKDEVKAVHFYLAAGSWTSRNKNAVFSPKFKFTANFFSSSPRGKPLFPLWEITRHFAQSVREGRRKFNSQQCWELSFAPVLALLAVCFRCDLVYKLKFKSM